VLKFIVNVVDDILKTDLDIPNGLAEASIGAVSKAQPLIFFQKKT
jgi:hypothetical protein